MTHKRFTRRQTKQAFPTFLMAASAQTVSSMSRKTGEPVLQVRSIGSTRSESKKTSVSDHDAIGMPSLRNETGGIRVQQRSVTSH